MPSYNPQAPDVYVYEESQGGQPIVAVGTSTYYPDTARARPDRIYHNVFLIEFDGAGRCREFTEHYMKEPEAEA